jgi:hypothetical protein
MRVTPLLCCCALALPFTACGGDVDPVSDPRGPAVTSPGTTIPYEAGGADGSGADGRTEAEERGGVAAGPDSGGR